MRSKRKYLCQELKSSFPADYLPIKYFSDVHLDHEFCVALENSVIGKSWDEVGTYIWVYEGTSLISIAKYYLLPKAYHYYIPSIITRALDEDERFDLMAEALLPNNQHREPRGQWWLEYSNLFTISQKKLIIEILFYFSDHFTVSQGEYYSSSSEYFEIERMFEIWSV